MRTYCFYTETLNVFFSLEKYISKGSNESFESRLDQEYGSFWSFFISGLFIPIKLSFGLQQFDSFKLFS